MTTTATTLRRVLNYVSRSEDVQELERISKAATARVREIRDEERTRRLRARFEELAAATVIVRDRSSGLAGFFGTTPELYRGDRWYVRGRHDGRKHVGLWVTRTPDEPRGRKSSVWLDLDDALDWIPAAPAEEIAELVTAEEG